MSASDAALGGRVATTGLSGSSTTDSNGVTAGAYVETTVTTGSYGDNNHTLDFGFNDPATPTPTPTPTPLPTVSTARTNAALGADGEGQALRNSVKRAIRAVAKDGRRSGCTNLSTTSRNTKLAAADSIYSGFWSQVWSLAGDNSILCANATVATGIAALRSDIDELRSVGRSALRLCPSGVSLRTVHTKRIAKQVTSCNFAVDELAAAFPSCG